MVRPYSPGPVIDPGPRAGSGRPTGSFRLLTLLALLALLVGPLQRTSAQPDNGPPPATPRDQGICATGRLHVADIPRLAEPWRITVEADRSLAVEWRPDAVLVATDLSCGFIVDEPRVRTTFYSADAKGIWDPETATIRPLDPGDPEPKELPSTNVSFDVVHDAMQALGIGEDEEIGASGITIRLNTADPQFGPPSVPAETIVVHLTVGSGGATRDVYVDAETGKTFDYGEGTRHDDAADRGH